MNDGEAQYTIAYTCNHNQVLKRMSPINPQPRNKISSELFRFVNLRAPRRKGATPATVAVRYHPENFVTVKKSLYHQFIAAKKPGDDRTNFKTGFLLMEQYKTTGDFIPDTEAGQKKFSGFEAFYDWCSGSKTNDRRALKEKAKQLLGKSPEEFTKDIGNQSVAWDNYFIYVSEQSNPALLQFLTHVLRVYVILQQIGADKPLDMERLEKAPVVIPREILLVDFPETNLPVTETDGNETTSASEQLQRLVQARKEIVAMSRKKQPVKPAPAEQTPEMITDYGAVALIAEISKLSTVWEALSDDTRNVLQELNITPEDGAIPAALDRIHEEMTMQQARLAADAAVFERLILIGDSLVRFPEAESKEVGTRSTKSSVNTDDDPFVSIYNCVMEKNRDLRMNISIGDFLKVEQELKCYQPGEIAHIENVLKGESKTHETRRLERTEDRYSYESDSNTEEERDVQTTDRFEMEKATEKVIDTDTSLEAGINVTAKYGMVELSSNLAFSTGISTHDAQKSAISYAKNVTERARSKVSKSVKESRSSTTIREFEDKNQHILKAEDAHTVGIYRWVDKIYKTRLVNYGRRLMIRFDIPEPSAFHIYASYHANSLSGEVRMPVHPAEMKIDNQKLTSFQVISEDNYALWAAAYNAEVSPPPKEFIHIGLSIDNKDGNEIKMVSERIATGEKESLVIPAGYKPLSAHVRADFQAGATPGGWPMAIIYVGNSGFFFSADPNIQASQRRAALQEDINFEYQHFADNKVPIVYRITNSDNLISTIVLKCTRSEESMLKWKMDVYKAIMQAYEGQKADAENKISQMKAMKGVQISGKNPLRNRETIQNNLKRSCIEMVRAYNRPFQHHLPHMQGSTPSVTGDWGEMPVLYNPYTAIQEGKYVHFMERCFEWSQMTYVFHPFFWARKDWWSKLYSLEDTDPLFTNFLQAGSASVVVPVNIGFEKQLMYFIRTGKLWLGADTPVIDAELDEYITTELGDADPTADPTVEACWDMRLPTNLVILQEDASGIDENGLPCYDITCEG